MQIMLTNHFTMEKKTPDTGIKWIIPAGITLVLLSLTGIGYYQAFHNPKPPKILDTFGNQQIDTVDAAGKETSITRIHTIPDFSFTDQNGKTLDQKTTEGKTYVADFFFTTCESICPVMGKSIMKLAKQFETDSDILFLSHTVDPETDSVPQLKAYAAAHQAKEGQWYFLTGDKKALYDIARNGYFSTATKGNGGPDDFIHTQNFVLVDKYRQIRGFYDGTDSTEMDKLYKDILLLKQEYAWRDAGGKDN
jgi:protein SCO1/2